MHYLQYLLHALLSSLVNLHGLPLSSVYSGKAFQM